MDTRALSTPSRLTYSSIEGVSVPLKRSYTMKRLYATMAILLLSGGLALAQGTRGGTGPSTGSSATSPPNPSFSPWPTRGRPPGGTPTNSQDPPNPTNPQNPPRPAPSNPQDLKR